MFDFGQDPLMSLVAEYPSLFGATPKASYLVLRTLSKQSFC